MAIGQADPIRQTSVVAITGATGYIGSRLVDRAVREGHAVYALGRTPLRRSGVVDLPYDLHGQDRVALPQDLAALIHLAATTSSQSVERWRREVVAAERLAKMVPQTAKFVFVSSQSAAPDAVSDYGRTKWAIETVVAGRGGISVRPGLVYGGPERALFGRICRGIRFMPVLPLFVSPRPITQPIHVDDLVAGILRLADRAWRGGPIVTLAQSQPIPFDRFLKMIAARRLGVRRFFLPVPLTVTSTLLSLLGRLLGRDLGGGQLASLAQTRALHTASDLALLDLNLRPLDVGLAGSVPSVRRVLINEGTRLLAYILRAPPKLSLVQRYVQTLEARDDTPLVRYREFSFLSNLALSIVDRRGSEDNRDRALTRRLDLALRIAEASPQSFDRFVGEDAEVFQRLRAACDIGKVIVREVFVRILRIFAAGLARRILFGQAVPDE